MFFRVSETKCPSAHPAACGIVHFRVSETKCPSAQPKKRGAGKDVTACGIVQFKVSETKCPSARSTAAGGIVHFQVFETKCPSAHPAACGIVHFRVSETKCPSAQPKKRGAGKDVTAAYNSKFPRPSAQVHTRKRGANDAVPDTTGRALGHLLSKVSNYIFNSYRERGAWTRARRGIFQSFGM